jgi:hypothetical protein
MMNDMSNSNDNLQQVLRNLNAVEEAVKGTWFSSNRKYSAAISSLEEVVEPFLENLIAASTVDKDNIVERIRKRRSSLPLASEIMTEVVGICKQVLAFGAAGLGLSIGFADKVTSLAPALQKAITIAGIVYLEIVLLSLLVLIMYLLYARYRYPFLSFKEIGNTWPWFYYASINPNVPREPIQTPHRHFRGAVFFAKDLVQFSNKVLSEGKDEELRMELQQYFLLVSYQGYVNQFSLRITNTFFYGLVGALATSAFLAILAMVR